MRGQLPQTGLDWIADGFLLAIVGGIMLAFWLYLRTAYKLGGWPRVRRDFGVAIVAILVFFLERILENASISNLEQTVRDLLK